MNTIFCYKKCSTCQKALKYLKDNNINYQTIELNLEKLTYDEIKKYHELSKLDIKKFFNTSGKLYKELNLSTRLKEMTIDEKYRILSFDGMLVKRPLLVTSKGVYPGFDSDIWNQLLD